MPTRPDIPNFLYVGAAKCASTWIYRTLQAHPQVFIPPAKEIFFFDREFHRGLDWYRSFFTDASSKQMRVGELSHFYLYSREVAQQIAMILPKAKLLACVRNPIHRAWSAYLFKKRNGLTSADFFGAAQEDPRIIAYGCYAEHVHFYCRLFASDQFRVLVFDDLEADPVAFARDIYTYLGVDPGFNNPFSRRKELVASRPRSARVAAFTRRAARVVRKLGFPNLVGHTKRSMLVRNLLYAPLSPEQKERMSLDTWKQLAKLYAGDVDQLSQILRRDLSHWLRPPESLVQSGSMSVNGVLAPTESSNAKAS
jgi:hypothetical protein